MSEHHVTTEARKVVTVLFADIQGSTQLGEALDPESLRDMLSRYFAEVRRVIERHEGIVEKFIGDAVMAVYGLPRVHEDDALRAVRAADEMRAVLAALNEDFAAVWGVRVSVRTGINTGEILARERPAGESIVLGDAVNVAARLEQEAAPGEILIGEATYRLVHDAVTAESMGPLTLKGKAAPVPAWRLVRVTAHAPGWSRRLDSPLVGRARELAELERAFGRAADTRTCQLVTVMGPAGVGKSRLTAELVSGLGARARVVQGRCLPYGEGITFWPLVSVLLQALDLGERDPESAARARIAGLVGRDAAPGDEAARLADALAPLLGFGADQGIQETYWAVRRLLERLAARGPVVVVFDDIHWAEPTFLDLVEYLGDWIRSAPVLIVCQARPELLEFRPAWLTAKDNASLIVVRPLDAPESDTLIRGLVGDAELPPEARARIAAVGEGNPLFVEEILRMLVDDGVLRSEEGHWSVAGDLSRVTIPPTIHSLITARLDRLEPAQRAIVERASVVGRSFWWGAVTALSPPAARPGVAACLQALVRKDLIEPDRSEIRQEDAYRFTHILVRDAAYRGIPKTVRAAMHEQLAEWIDRRARDLGGDYDEFVGYHLEQAHRALTELGPATDQVRALAGRAARPLATAGERAFARGDMPAAVSLLTRATALLPEHDPRRLELLPGLAFALMETADFDRLVDVSGTMDAAAAATGDPTLRAHASVVALATRVFTAPEGWAAEAERVAAEAIRSFGDLGDERGLGRAWALLGLVRLMYARFGPAEEAWSEAAEHARRAGQRREAMESLAWVPLMLASGPTPAEEGIRRCREVLDRADGDRKVMSSALFSQADFEAYLGRFDEARDLLAHARALLEEVALPVWAAGPLAQEAGWIELLAGDPAAAEAALRRGFETLDTIGEVAWLSTDAGILAEAVHAQGRYDEALRFTRISEELAGAEDVYSNVLWRSVRAKVLARRGETAEAIRLANASARLAESTDFLHLRWHDLMCRAETLRLAGRTAEADAAADEAVRVATAKGNLVGARLARRARGRDPGVEAARRA